MILKLLKNYVEENKLCYKDVPIVITTYDDISYAPCFFNDENEKFISFFLKTNQGNYFKIIPKEEIKVIEIVYSNEGELIKGDQILDIIFKEEIKEDNEDKMYG